LTGGGNNADLQEEEGEPQPGCSHWTQESVPVAPAAAGGGAVAVATAGDSSNSSGTASPLQRVSSSLAAPIDWEGMYNELYARHASLITRLQVTFFLS